MNNLLQSALAFLNKGISVVATIGKRPTGEWAQYEQRLPTEQELVAMFTPPPSGSPTPTGLAIVSGPATWQAHPHLYVLEIEQRYRVVAEPWLNQHLAGWQQGLLVESGGGSLHVYLKSPVPVDTRKHDWGEIRGRGSITAVPPTIHPETHRPYRYLSKGAALEIDPATLPLPGLLPQGSGKGYEQLLTGEVHKGEGRNMALTSLGGLLRQKGFDVGVIKAALMAINKTCCRPPLPAREVEGIAHSMSRYEPGTPNLGLIAGVDFSQGRVVLSQVTPKKMQHLWPGWIPRGKAGELLGDPGLGKGTILCDLAARITTHQPMPGDQLCQLEGPMGVVWYSAEDAVEDTLVPRLMAAGADLTKIVVRRFVPDGFAGSGGAGGGGERLPDLSRDLDYLEDDIKLVSAALVVIDPATAFFPETANSYKDQDVRRVMTPLAHLAEKTGTTIITVRHLNKSTSSSPVYRGGGSVAFTASARFSVVAAKDPADETGERRVLAVNKSNTYKETPAKTYKLVNTPEYEVGKVEWLGTAGYTASTLLSTAITSLSGEELSKVDEAELQLRELLAGGSQPADDVIKALKALSFSETTIDRAKRKLRVTSKRVGGVGKDGHWVWTPPEDPPTRPTPIIAPSPSPPDPAPSGDPPQSGASPEEAGDGPLIGLAPGKTDPTHYTDRGAIANEGSSTVDDQSPEVKSGNSTKGANSLQLVPLAGEAPPAMPRAPTSTKDLNATRLTPLAEVGALSATMGAVDYMLLTQTEEVQRLLPHLLAAPVLGLDTETTGLDPHRDRLRLIQLATQDGVFVIDCAQVDPRVLSPLVNEAHLLAGHNLKFDLQFLAQAGLPVPDGARLFDTMLGAQLLGAGTDEGLLSRCGLGAVTKRLLNVELDKTLQQSDWSGPLSAEQLDYAARDTAVLLPLIDQLQTQLARAGLSRITDIEMGALSTLVWLELTGAPFDQEAWADCAARAQTSKEEYERELNKLVGPDCTRPTTEAGSSGQMELFEKAAPGRGINWNSHKQVLKLLQSRGYKIKRTNEATLRRIAGPFAGARAQASLPDLLLKYREAQRRVSTYGLGFQEEYRHPVTGRVHADYLQIGAASGRMACRGPNLQSIPRDPAYRACFRPAEGRRLVKADYSQLELRVVAELTGDARMTEAYCNGEDLHAVTAAAVLGRSNGEVSHEDRQAAKALNFGLIYGMGARGLREYAATNHGVYLTEEEARTFKERFFTTYPAIGKWHRDQREGKMETRTMAGRRRLDVRFFTEKLNTPVQGTGADGLKLALALLWETRGRCQSAAPVLVVHDEIVVECAAAEADEAKEWLTESMERGMGYLLKSVPVRADARISSDWSGTP